MLILTFNYTKADGSISKRVIAPHTQPTHLYSGTDISELEIEEQVKFTSDLNNLHDKHASEMAELIDRHDLNRRYRQFKPECMTDIKREFI